MRRAAVLLCLVLSACTGSKGANLAPLRAAAALAPCPASVGDLPALRLACLGGGPKVHLHGTPTGTPTLVNIYGSWCTPCQREMPLLVSFSKRAAGKVTLLGVDTEDEDRLALLFAKYVGQHWAAVVDTDGILVRNYAAGPPVTLFVDGSGKVVYVKAGPFASVSEVVSLVKRHFGVAV